MRETELKIFLTRWLLAQLTTGEVIASELQFSNALNRADIALSSSTRLTSYEIKSSYDDFRRFEQQQDSYRASFLESYLVVPDALLSIAREHLARPTGIITISDHGEVNFRRKSLAKQKLSRPAANAWLREIDKRRIKSELGIQFESLSEQALTEHVLRLIHARLSPRFAAFLKERGKSFNSDDLAMLSLPTKIR